MIGPEQVDALTVVQDFYEHHPYPPPVTNLDRVQDAWDDLDRKRADHYLFWPTKPYREEIDILVAGCGTAQAAEYAIRHPAARVVGIDFSANSVRHTQALKEAYALNNLSVHQLAVESVNDLKLCFDKIICTGVLHHLPDPDLGLRTLRSVLKPDGAMHLMVYASYGRTGIYMLQDYARRLNVKPSDAEIHELVAVLMELPEGHPLEHLLRTAPDFRRKAALADALLNPLDRAYTVPELYALLARNRLWLGRWLRQAPYLPQCGAPAATPHRARLERLPLPEQHAALELLRGTMVRHSAIVYPADEYQHDGDADNYLAAHQPDFMDADRWLGYVPLRLPHTRCIEERVPPGAVAVLLNQSHTYPDLYLPIDPYEKQLFDAIDGRRSIGELLELTVTGNTQCQQCQRAARFFQQLWQYDQVVFDMSRKRPNFLQQE